MNRTRRKFLRATLAGAAGVTLAGSWLVSRPAHAEWPGAAFAAKTPADALYVLFGDVTIEQTDRITIDLPDLAEDGAVVPLTVRTELSGVQSITILAEKNPVKLIARFDFGENRAGDYLATRIKLAESQPVTVVVQAGDRLYVAKRHVEVMVGGCS
jgi:sulfur-oxidizing protein SoxY